MRAAAGLQVDQWRVAIVVTKIEKKSATTRRVVLGFVP